MKFIYVIQNKAIYLQYKTIRNMKITTRTVSWGIELKNDTVTEEITQSDQIEIKETIINFLEVTRDLTNLLNNALLRAEIYNLINKTIDKSENI